MHGKRKTGKELIKTNFHGQALNMTSIAKQQ